MSGPKVVRIVTREELEALCRERIALFAAAAAELLRAAGPAAAEAGLREELERRRRRLAELFAADRFLEVQEQAAKSATFLKLEAERVETAARQLATSVRERRRRLADAAASVARSFPQAAAEMHELARRAMTVAESDLAAEQQQLDRALAALLPRAAAEAAPSVEQRELAARLGVGQARPGEPMPRQAESERRELRIDGALAELEVLAGEDAAREFARRAAALLEEPEARQALLADSLLLDLAVELRRQRERAALRARLVAARAKLASAGGGSELEARLENALADPEAAAAEPLLAAAEEAAKRHRDEIAAASRRQAILGALATLGYEVRESLGTAWVESGRIVVKKPGQQDYGVELGAPADASRLQVRLVGAAEPQAARGPARDRDQETIFCGELEKLKELFAAQGGELVVEKALAAGAVPVKTVPFPEAERREVEEPRARSLRPGG